MIFPIQYNKGGRKSEPFTDINTKKEKTVMKKTKMLIKNYQFKNLFLKGKYYSGEYIESFIKSNNLNYNLLGIAIGVKIAKATKRNRIKRLIRENYRLIEKDLKTGYSIIFLWKKKKDTSYANFENIKKDIKTILNKANIIEENNEKIIY